MTDWVQGDVTGLSIPAHAAALREGGAAWLTRAFHAGGALPATARVAHIVAARDIVGGSTGRKLLLTLAYDGAELPAELFVKFSRDLDDPIRDRGRDQLELEVRFGLLSREPGFPIAVPTCLFADYHHASGTGLLVTTRVPFGRDGVERAWDKCRDDEVPDALGHYRAILTALGRLAGTHRAGGLPASVAAQFPFDAAAAMRADPIRHTADQLDRRVDRLAGFAAANGRLLPANLRDAAFYARMRADVPRLLAAEPAIKRHLASDPSMIALCHLNANIDNAWFWRESDRTLRCGLMDWGRVGQMNLAFSLWGCLSAAEPAMWDDHLDDLIACYVEAFAEAGAVPPDRATILRHLFLHVAMMGLAWLMDGPAFLRRLVPDIDAVPDRHDPRIRDDEAARSQLHMLTAMLNLWDRRRFGEVLERALPERA